MKTEDIKEIASAVEGWLHPLEGTLLYRLARQCTGKGAIVEIGSWKGKSTIWLAAGSKSGMNGKVYAIDPHIGSSEHQHVQENVWTFDQFTRNIERAGIHDTVVPIVATSEEAAKNFEKPVELIFIDGGHEYQMVKLDFDLWSPKVVEGGVMAFHDTVGWPGPKQVVKEFVVRSKQFRNVRFVHSILYAQKVLQSSFTDQIRNRYVFFLLNVYQFFGCRWLPRIVRAAIIKSFSLIQ